MADLTNDKSLYETLEHNDFANLQSINTQDLLSMDSFNLDNMNVDFNMEEKPNLPAYDFSSQDQLTLFRSEPVESNFVLPLHFGKMPVIDEIDTQYQFDVTLNGDTSGKVSWMYSAKLKKVYIKMGQVVRVYVNYKFPECETDLFLRAMVLYSNSDEMPSPVTRCPNHRASSGPPDYLAPHILRCEHRQTSYFGKEDGIKFGERLCIYLPLKEIAENEPISLLFTCQNSCSGGMNRKSTVIVFNLENSQGDILGKKLMHFKVCSCPKRDKDKEEEALTTLEQQPKQKKRKASDAAFNHPSCSNKRPIKYVVNHVVKTEPGVTPPYDGKVLRSMSPHVPPNVNSDSDNEEVKFEIVMPNKKAMQHVLKCAYNEISGSMTNKGTQSAKSLMPYLKNIKQLQETLQSSSSTQESTLSD